MAKFEAHVAIKAYPGLGKKKELHKHDDLYYQLTVKVYHNDYLRIQHNLVL